MGDAVKGKTLFMKVCAGCHTIEKDGKHKMGPNLHNIVGKTCGTIPGYAFTDAMKKKAIKWDEETLNEYLESPKKFVPGTKKPFAGVKKLQDRRDIIAFLLTSK